MITVLLADDQTLVRDGLRLILEAQDDMRVVADVADGDLAVGAARAHRPDVALLDIEMPVANGLDAARAILADPGLATRVVMLTTFDRDEYLYAALAAGASGFLLKSSPRAHLLHAIRTAAAGEALLDPAVTRRLIETYVRRPAPLDPGALPAAVVALSPREIDVLRELVAGASNSEIGARLFLADTTVKSHVAAVLRKLGLRDRTQAVIFGYETGLAVPGDREP